MTSPDEPRTASLYHTTVAEPVAQRDAAAAAVDARAPVVDPALAAAILTAAMASYLVAAMLVPRSLAVLAAQLALAIVPIGAVALVARARVAEHGGRPPTRAWLGITGAPLRFFVAALAIGLTAWYLNMRVVLELPITEHHTRTLSALVARPSLAAAIAMFAVVPAVCEELLFRGVLARSLGRHLPAVAAAAISAVVFSAYHLSLAQALPTLTLGFVLALITIRADSIVPAVVAHAVNNVVTIAVSRDAVPGLANWLTAHPTLALAGCASVTAAGIAITLRGSRGGKPPRSSAPRDHRRE
jgi:membrane protease YdiL (CAAX protease family)